MGEPGCLLGGLGGGGLYSRQDGRCEVSPVKLKHRFAFQVFSFYTRPNRGGRLKVGRATLRSAFPRQAFGAEGLNQVVLSPRGHFAVSGDLLDPHEGRVPLASRGGRPNPSLGKGHYWGSGGAGRGELVFTHTSRPLRVPRPAQHHRYRLWFSLPAAGQLRAAGCLLQRAHSWD